MCYETTARPPYPPIAGGSATGESITLSAADGNTFAAFSAPAAEANGAGVVILPDVRGLHAFYEDLALRFAEIGVHATAFDYFGRTAGVGRREGDFDFWPEVMKTTPDTVAADVAATAAHVRGLGAERLYTVGFCFGGRHSFNQAARDHGLDGVVGFYGRLGQFNPEETDQPADLAKDYRCKVLGLFGGADQMIPGDQVDAFDAALAAADVSRDIVTYEGAPHSFFDRSFDEHAQACQDAWRKILSFMDVA